MKDLKAIKGKYYLARIIAEGEHRQQDFKFAISDACKIARSLSAFANCSGGRLLIGVKDNGVIAGVRNEEDIYVIEQAASLYCRPAQQLKFTAFTSEEGAIVIRAEIEAASKRPVCARDTDGQWKAYYRVADENILAPPLMVKSWRRKASSRPLTLSLGRAEETLLAMLRRDQNVNIENFMHEARLSRHAAEDTVARLYAIGIVDFTFVGREFQLILAANTDENDAK